MKYSKSKISVLGDGGWGTTIALHLAKTVPQVQLWGAFPDYTRQMSQTRENKKFLPGFSIPENVIITSDLQSAFLADLIFVAIPSKYLRKVLDGINRSWLKEQRYVILSKGIEPETLATMSDVVRDALNTSRTAVVSGPCISREIASEIPTAVTVASEDPEFRAGVRELLQSDFFNVLESDDQVGVQLGGSLKNVLAIAAGIFDGLDLGTNLKAVLATRGLAEMARLGREMGAKNETFMGLSGIGDLITTSFSSNSRNHNCGVQLAKGDSLKSILERTEMVIEGVETSISAAALAEKYSVSMPIMKSVHEILFKDKAPELLLDAVMNRDHHIEVH